MRRKESVGVRLNICETQKERLHVCYQAAQRNLLSGHS